MSTHILKTKLQAFQEINIICGGVGSKTTKKQMKNKHFQMCKECTNPRRLEKTVSADGCTKSKSRGLEP